MQTASTSELISAYLLSNSFGNGAGEFGSRVRQDDYKFIATIATRNIFAADLLEQRILSLIAFRDIADVALDDPFAAHQTCITDEFHIDQLAALRSQRHVFTANIFILLQNFEGLPAGFNILECADFPKFLADRLFPRIPQQFN